MKKKLLAAVLSVAMLATSIPVGVMAAEVSKAEKKVTIEVTAQGQTVVTDEKTKESERKYVCTPKKFKVDSDIAEKYGYTDNVKDAVSGLDVLVTMTKDVYGKSFTKEKATKYLEVSEQGWITKIFKLETMSSAFILNNELPWDLINTLKVEDKSNMTFFVYEDAMCSDIYSYPTEECTTSVKYNGDVEVAFAGKGYDSNWAFTDASLKGASVGILDVKKKTVKAIKDVTLDENGKATIKGLSAGTYYLTAMGRATVSETVSVPVVMNPVKVTINKVKQEVTVNITKKNIKAKKVKKADQKFKIVTNVLGKAKVTYKSNKSKYIKVSNSGNVTVKKKTPKGTYKITIKVAATKKYEAATKTVVITVK